MGSASSKTRRQSLLSTRNRTSPSVDHASIPQAAESSETETGVYQTIGGPSFQKPYRDPASIEDTTQFPLDDEVDIVSVSDERLLELFNTAPRLHHLDDDKIVRISKTLVIKGGTGIGLSESSNMRFAAESLLLPVPRVHRAFTAAVPEPWDPNSTVDAHFIVMDYISGRTIQETWSSLSHEVRESLASQVADMIRTMQARPFNDKAPGPLGRGPDEKFEGPWFTHFGCDPIASLQALEDWFNHKVDVCVMVTELPPDYPRFKFSGLVFTHQDIAMRNLIVDAAGKAWLIDWGCAGMYPPGFEQVALREQCENKDFLEMILAKLSNRYDDLTAQKAGIAYGLSTGRHL